MTTTTLSSKKKRSPFMEFLFSYKNFSILYGIILFVFVPLTSLNNFNMSVFDILVCALTSVVIPYFMVGIIFGFLHGKRATDLYGALPIKREKLLLSIFGAGYVSVIIPFLINYLIKLILVFNKLKPLEISAFIRMIFASCLYCFILMAVFTFVVVLVGTKLEYFGYAAAVGGAATVILFVIMLFCNLLYGFGEEERFLMLINQSSPIMSSINAISKTTFFGMSNSPLFSFGTIFWTIIGIAALIFSMFIFKKRKNEIAENAARGSVIGYIIRVIGAFCGGTAFYAIGVGTNFSPVFLSFVGGFLGYIICDIVFRKSFVGCVKAFIPSSACALAMAIFCLFFQTGGFGYEKRIPEIEKIEDITLFINQNNYYRNNPIKITSDKGKKVVTDLHSLILDCYNDYNAKEENYKKHISDYRAYNPTFDNAFFKFQPEYSLKSGNQRRKYYRLNYGSHYGELCEKIAELMSLKETKTSSDPIFVLESEDIISAEFSNKIGSYKKSMELGKDKTKRLIEAIRQDTLERNYKSIIYDGTKDYGYISFSVLENTLINKSLPIAAPSTRIADKENIESNYEVKVYFPVSESDVNTVKLLSEFGYLSISQKGFDSIEKVSIPSFYNGNNLNPVSFRNTEEGTAEDRYKSIDEKIINDLVDKIILYEINCENIGLSTAPLGFVFENGTEKQGYIRIKDIPAEIFKDDFENLQISNELLEIINELLLKYPDSYSDNLLTFLHSNTYISMYDAYINNKALEGIFSKEDLEKGKIIREYLDNSEKSEEFYSLSDIPAYSAYVISNNK